MGLFSDEDDSGSGSSSPDSNDCLNLSPDDYIKKKLRLIKKELKSEQKAAERLKKKLTDKEKRIQELESKEEEYQNLLIKNMENSLNKSPSSTNPTPNIPHRCPQSIDQSSEFCRKFCMGLGIIVFLIVLWEIFIKLCY